MTTQNPRPEYESVEEASLSKLKEKGSSKDVRLLAAVTEKEIERLANEIRTYKDGFKQQKDDIEDLKKEIKQQSRSIPEIVGLFSAIIAIVLIDVSIIKSAQGFLSAILLVTALTCSVIVFAWLIHLFFTAKENKKENEKFGGFFWIPIIFLGALIVLGVVFRVFEINLY